MHHSKEMRPGYWNTDKVMQDVQGRFRLGTFVQRKSHMDYPTGWKLYFNPDFDQEAPHTAMNPRFIGDWEPTLHKAWIQVPENGVRWVTEAPLYITDEKYLQYAVEQEGCWGARVTYDEEAKGWLGPTDVPDPVELARVATLWREQKWRRQEIKARLKMVKPFWRFRDLRSTPPEDLEGPRR